MALNEQHSFLRIIGLSPQDTDWNALRDFLLKRKEQTKLLDPGILLQILTEILKIAGSSDNPTLPSIVNLLLSTNKAIESFFPLDIGSVGAIIADNRFLTTPVMDEILHHFFRNTNEVQFEKTKYDAAQKILSQAIKCKSIGVIKSIIHMFPSVWKDWKDAMGMTPFHIVFGYTETNENTNSGQLNDVEVIQRSTILELMLSAIAPNERYSAVLAKCCEGQNTTLSTPIDCAIYYLNVQYKQKLQHECEDEWKCLQLCVEAAGEKIQIIHYCITLKLLSLHDKLLTDMIVRLGDLYANVNEPDGHGKTPLLLAIQEHKLPYIHQLLRLKPNSAKFRIQSYYDSNNGKWYKGRLPLHAALDYCGEDGKLEWEGVDLILKASSANALRVQDPVTGLYPFMQVASRRRNDRSGCLNDIYCLLLSDPCALEYRKQCTKTKTSSSVSTFFSIITIAIVLIGIRWELLWNICYEK